jgi:hypothetical protein
MIPGEMSCESPPTFLIISSLPRECWSSSCCPANSRRVPLNPVNECNGELPNWLIALRVVPVEYSESHADYQAKCADHEHDEGIS